MIGIPCQCPITQSCPARSTMFRTHTLSKIGHWGRWGEGNGSLSRVLANLSVAAGPNVATR